jgi:bifunctional DNA-binding transcriptional regulator/antitoxin component of YhaV-PrlF toxin-antitoxin module
VRVDEVLDCFPNPKTGGLKDIQIHMPKRAGYTHDISQGDLVAFTDDEQGQWVIVTDYTAGDTGAKRFWGNVREIDANDPDSGCKAVVVDPVPECFSGSSGGGAVHVITPERDGVEIKLSIDDIICYTLGPNHNPPDRTEYVIQSDYSSGIVIEYALMTGDAMAPQQPSLSACWTGPAQIAEDCSGTINGGPNVTVHFPARDRTRVDIQPGDVVSVAQARNGNWVCLSDYTASASIGWAVATSRAAPAPSGSCWTFQAQPVLDCVGTRIPAPTPPPVTINCPTVNLSGSPSEGGVVYDADIDVGDIVNYATTIYGDTVCVSRYARNVSEPKIDFQLTTALTGEFASALIIKSYGEAGYGESVGDNVIGAEIDVYNLQKGAGGWVFEGIVGARGRAGWDRGTNYIIYNMECPPEQ